MSGSMVVLGVPEQPVFIPAEEGVTKIGGVPRWLCGEPKSLKQTKCVKCNCQLALLVSADCPVADDYDRIVYVFICPKCGQEGKVYRQKKVAIFTDGADGPLFTSNDISNTNDYNNDSNNSDNKTPTIGANNNIMSALSAFNNNNNNKQSKKAKRKQKERGKWPAFYVETFDEPEAMLDPDIKYVLSTSADSTSSAMGDDDKPSVEIAPELIEYNERMSRCPDQVLRYSRFGEPLLQDKFDIAPIPPCPKCGAERIFEFEVMPTIIYTLEPDSSMDFGPILVYTCSADCNGCVNDTCEEHLVISPP